MKLKDAELKDKIRTLLLIGCLSVTSPAWAQLPEIDLKLVPEGYFSMGDHYSEGSANELPIHYLSVSDFMIGTYEVSKAEWSAVISWASKNGYPDLKNPGQAGSDSKNLYNHPVTQVNWYEIVKWCNALSEWSGLDPVYWLTDEAGNKQSIYREGNHNDVMMDVDANGYRLPTEAEWEKAARGSLVAHYFPWPSSGKKDETYADHIDSGLAVYFGSDDNSTVGNDDTAYRANGYGLYHMSGNVWEWVWDWYDSDWYSKVDASINDTLGPVSGSGRVNRGGSWNFEANFCRVATRLSSLPDNKSYDLGFRVCLNVQKKSPKAEQAKSKKDTTETNAEADAVPPSSSLENEEIDVVLPSSSLEDEEPDVVPPSSSLENEETMENSADVPLEPQDSLESN